MPSVYPSTAQHCQIPAIAKGSPEVSPKVNPMSDAPARHLNLAGASNFRDLGGYPGKDGRSVRWRQIFRSNHLGHVTEADIGVLRGLGVKSAFDFRGTEERASAICGIADIEVHSLPI